MKLYDLMTLLVMLTSFLTYKAQGIRPGKVALSASNHQDIIKISPLSKGSMPYDQLLAKSAKLSSGVNRKLMTKITSSSTPVAIGSENQKNKYDPKLQVKSTHQLAGKEEQYPDVTDIAEMDYTPARKKSPIHN